MQTNDVRHKQVPEPDPHGVVILDRARRVISANTFARELIEDSNAIRLPPKSSNSGVFRVPRRSGTPLLAASVAMPPPFSGDLDSIILLWDPQRLPVPRSDILRQAFGLTAAEAATAVDLYDGKTPAEIAEGRMRSINTVRTLLGRVYSKCAVRRQAQLVRLLGGIIHMSGMIEGIEAVLGASRGAALLDNAAPVGEGAVIHAVDRLARMETKVSMVHFAPGEIRPFHFHTGHEILSVMNGTLSTETATAQLASGAGEARHIGSSLVHRGANRDTHASLNVLVVQIKQANKPFKVNV